MHLVHLLVLLHSNKDEKVIDGLDEISSLDVNFTYPVISSSIFCSVPFFFPRVHLLKLVLLLQIFFSLSFSSYLSSVLIPLEPLISRMEGLMSNYYPMFHLC